MIIDIGGAIKLKSLKELENYTLDKELVFTDLYTAPELVKASYNLASANSVNLI